MRIILIHPIVFQSRMVLFALDDSGHIWMYDREKWHPLASPEMPRL